MKTMILNYIKYQLYQMMLASFKYALKTGRIVSYKEILFNFIFLHILILPLMPVIFFRSAMLSFTRGLFEQHKVLNLSWDVVVVAITLLITIPLYLPTLLYSVIVLLMEVMFGQNDQFEQFITELFLTLAILFFV